MGGKALNLVGQRFGRLTVIERDGKDSIGGARWRCRCDCGKVKVISGRSLKSGASQSCGCQRVHIVKHGQSGTPEYQTWYNMIQRCTNPDHPAYKNYGARNIVVCQRWRELESFVADVFPRPEGASLDRIDNDKGYTCGHCEDCKAKGWELNVRWANNDQQAYNRRNSRIIEVNGESLTLKEASAKTGIPYQILLRRVRAGWDAELALSTPPQRA